MSHSYAPLLFLYMILITHLSTTSLNAIISVPSLLRKYTKYITKHNFFSFHLCISGCMRVLNLDLLWMCESWCSLVFSLWTRVHTHVCCMYGISQVSLLAFCRENKHTTSIPLSLAKKTFIRTACVSRELTVLFIVFGRLPNTQFAWRTCCFFLAMFKKSRN